ncbi:MAG TPA: AraC family ligand binding domain-containing protein [Vicinamibacterales bacterium]|jgi:mannose-6-phosphate isomerase-like protein (cupin superfamily)|nr:AraC family ligand binding domain-containing protein [Vicinamibacterales bacterium]
MTVVKSALMGALGGAAVMACLAAALVAQDSGPEPQCTMCPAYYLDNREIQEYVAKAMKERLVDQQIRDVEIGKAHVGVGVVYRGKLDKPGPNSVAEHDLVSEVYHIIEGTATFVTGPDLVGKTRRPATLETVRLFNGPGNGASSIRNGVTHQLKPGDVMVIPAGTGHWFTKIDDHITYLMVRFDPDRVTPLKDEAASRVWLQTPHAPSN